MADAVLGDVDDVLSTYLRAGAVASEIAGGDMTPVIQSFVRAKNISSKADKGNDSIDESLFIEPVEKQLFDAFTSARDKADALIKRHDYVGAIDAMKGLAKPIDAFFDGVMVMDKDEKIRGNRLALLLALDTLIESVADFSRIVLDK